MGDHDVSAIKASCQYFLHGHGPSSPAHYFAQMANYMDAGAETKEAADVYGYGESLQAFETSLASLFGHKDAVFFQSGTMAQLIAMRLWTDQTNNPNIAFHPTCHLEIHEQEAYKHLHGLEALLVGESSRLISLSDLKSMAKLPAVVLFELPQREIGGQLPEWEDLKEQVAYLRNQGIKVHLDGARIWECGPYYKKSYGEIASLFDSVYVSFYKGIGAIAGAALLGSSEFCKMARVWNRRHGGNLYTAFPLYLSARLNMDRRLQKFESYAKKTFEVVELIDSLSGMTIFPVRPQVNMFHLSVQGKLDDLKSKALQASKETGVWGFDRLRESNSPGSCKLEWYVGDALVEAPMERVKDFLLRMQ